MVSQVCRSLSLLVIVAAAQVFVSKKGCLIIRRIFARSDSGRVGFPSTTSECKSRFFFSTLLQRQRACQLPGVVSLPAIKRLPHSVVNGLLSLTALCHGSGVLTEWIGQETGSARSSAPDCPDTVFTGAVLSATSKSKSKAPEYFHSRHGQLHFGISRVLPNGPDSTAWSIPVIP